MVRTKKIYESDESFFIRIWMEKEILILLLSIIFGKFNN